MAKNKLPVEKLSAKVKKAIPVKIVSETSCAPRSDRDYEAREKKYRAEEDLRTLQRANEIKTNKERMSAVKTVADELQKALK